MKKTTKSQDAATVLDGYSDHMQQKLSFLRRLILETATELELEEDLQETLKWGQLSFLTKRGSTIRIDGLKAKPDQFAMFFHCQSRLVDTFRTLYGDRFTFDGNRAIVFNQTEDVAVEELKHCVALALTYHDRKHLPLLGA